MLFLPVFGQKGAVPVKIKSVQVSDGSITLTVQPMTRDEQTALLSRIRESDPALADASAQRSKS